MEKADSSGIGTVDVQISRIEKANDLREVNKLLTQVMALQKIQPLIKGANLSHIADIVVDLALIGDGADSENRLIAAAVLGRLSAVGRGRTGEIYQRLGELFDDEPAGIDKLADGDEKYYASLTFHHVKAKWLMQYCIDQAYSTDAAEKARKVLFTIALKQTGNLSEFLQLHSVGIEQLRSIDNAETKYKRIRRITNALLEVFQEWQGEVGSHAGIALGDWLYSIMMSSNKDISDTVITDIIDDALGMTLRIIELRFSHALLAPTYKLLEKARTVVDRNAWSEIMRNSKKLERVRLCLKEAALVLASQGKTDTALVEVLAMAYYSKSQAMTAISAHFAVAHELEPNIRHWWENAGNVKKRVRDVEHKVGNSEDQQIGSLLINVEDSKSVMEKLSRAVVPMLEIQDPPLAATVKKAAGSYTEIALAARQLAVMRKLTHMEVKGEVLEYNPLQHEMLGGHQLGVRRVRVERDGIQKDFNGKIKVLVKPRVTPVDE
jgi:hypothetical protein